MKVTGELKRLINAAFELKVIKAKEELGKTNKEVWESKKNELENSEPFKNYVKACSELYEYIKDDVEFAGTNAWGEKLTKPYYYVRDEVNHLKEPKSTHFITSCITTFTNRQFKDDTQTAKDTLLVKLTYEKDLDKIKELLKEYDIEL